MGVRSLIKRMKETKNELLSGKFLEMDDYYDYRGANNLYYSFFGESGVNNKRYKKQKSDSDRKTKAVYGQSKNTYLRSADNKLTHVKQIINGNINAMLNCDAALRSGVFTEQEAKDYMNMVHEGTTHTNPDWVKLDKKKESKKFRDIRNDLSRNNTTNFDAMIKLAGEVNPDMSAAFTLATKHQHLTPEKMDFLLSSSKAIDEKLQEKFEKTLGEDWAKTDKFKEWFASDKGKKFLGVTGDKNLVQSILGDKKYNDTMKDIQKADAAGNLDLSNTTEFGKGTWKANKKKGGGLNMFDIMSGKNIGETLLNIGEFAVETAVDLATASVDWVVDIGEGIDDIIDGENVLDTLVDTTLKVTGVDTVGDIINDVAEGDYVGAALNGVELSADLNSMPGMDLNPAAEMTSVMADNLDNLTSTDPLLSGLRDDINDIPGGLGLALGLGDIDEGGIPSGDINMSSIDKTTMDELRELLGILPGGADSEVIEALVGSDARKLADNQDISSVLQQQRQVAEQGYDVGEREALSGKARRELAGMARKQGQAAGAAAGGLRGASVAAQSRALSEKAMQKQADVTTEMDKSSIARKDSARTNLANLAKDVTKFDVEKEQEKKKRKGATTIGVQSLLQAEETNKQMMDLANK